jgi:hypothetical protein
MKKVGKVMVCLLLVGMFLLPISALNFTREVANDVTVAYPNNPPNKPTLSGPQKGECNIPHHYTACATDPDGDRIFYSFDWGDGCQVTVSCCFASGECCTACYCWEEPGTYQVRVCAIDEHRCYGEYSDSLLVIMPKNSFQNAISSSSSIVSPL